jgi:hypothetical protein
VAARTERSRVTVDDENRTRTISLGNQQIAAPDRPDLRIRCTASDRHGPYATGVNGPSMARGPAAFGGWPRGLRLASSASAPGSRRWSWG